MTPARGALSRATAFLRSGSVGGPFPPRVAANMLHELDRLLHALLDEGGARPGQRHTANKLGSRASAGDGARLVALHRSAACLKHRDGRAARPDERGGRAMTLGWPDRPDGALRVVTLGEPVLPSRADLLDVCAFYDRLAAALP